MARNSENLASWIGRAKIGVLVFASGVAGGVVGVMMALGMFLVSSRDFLRDSADKHGISEVNASRFGGVMVFFGALFLFVVQLGLRDQGALVAGPPVESYFRGYEWVALLVGSIGLWEDSSQRLSPKLRLILLMSVVAAYFLANPSSLPTEVLSFYLPQILNNQWLIGLGATIFLVGFINAGNIADGANGLLSSIAVAVFFVAYFETGSLFYFSLLISLIVFVIFNTSTGLMFLGDFGSYSLSCLMALVCLDLYSQGNISVWFLACLLGYPCVELVLIMSDRWRRGVSVIIADNSHLHNRLFDMLRKKGLSTLAANSWTGMSLAVISTAVPITCYITGFLQVNSIIWAPIFLSYGGIHALFFMKFSKL